MEELNFKEEELKGFKEFNKGGYEGKILLYKPEILLKRFEPFIMPFLNMDNKKYKLIEFSKMNQLENIIALPKQLVNIDNTFSSFNGIVLGSMPVISWSILNTVGSSCPSISSFSSLPEIEW